MAFALKPGIHCCLRDDTPVFLDLTANRYFQLGEEAEHAFLALVQGVPMAQNHTACLRRLQADGLLEQVSGEAENAASLLTQHDCPTHEILGKPGVTALALLPLVLPMLLVTRLRLRLFPKSVLYRAGKRRLRLYSSHPMASIASFAAAFDLAGLFLSRADRCLERSLVMRDLLGLAGHRVDLVLGVATRPFGAHCWVQQGDGLIGDSIERVSFFQPIAVL